MHWFWSCRTNFIINHQEKKEIDNCKIAAQKTIERSKTVKYLDSKFSPQVSHVRADVFDVACTQSMMKADQGKAKQIT